MKKCNICGVEFTLDVNDKSHVLKELCPTCSDIEDKRYNKIKEIEDNVYSLFEEKLNKLKGVSKKNNTSLGKLNRLYQEQIERLDFCVEEFKKKPYHQISESIIEIMNSMMIGKYLIHEKETEEYIETDVIKTLETYYKNNANEEVEATKFTYRWGGTESIAYYNQSDAGHVFFLNDSDPLAVKKFKEVCYSFQTPSIKSSTYISLINYLKNNVDLNIIEDGNFLFDEFYFYHDSENYIVLIEKGKDILNDNFFVSNKEFFVISVGSSEIHLRKIINSSGLPMSTIDELSKEYECHYNPYTAEHDFEKVIHKWVFENGNLISIYDEILGKIKYNTKEIKEKCEV